MANRIEIREAKNKQLFVSVKSANNKKIANTETYKTPAGARNAVEALKKIIKNPEIVDKTGRVIKK